MSETRAPQKCPKCDRPGVFIRTRHFEDGTSDVWMCDNRRCSSYTLYWHVDYPKRVRIAQLLCPSRHCIAASPYQWPDVSMEQAEALLHDLVEQLRMNPWCGICGSQDLKVDDQPTKWTTMQEAAPHIAEIAARNLAGLAHFQRHRAGQS